MLLYGIAGGACAFTHDFNLLLALRFLQGLGATAAGTLSVAIIGDIYSGKRRTIAMSYNIGVLNAGTMSFPIIGGGLAMFGWQYPFLLPLAAIPLAFAMMYGLKYPEPENHQVFREYNIPEYSLPAVDYAAVRQLRKYPRIRVNRTRLSWIYNMLHGGFISFHNNTINIINLNRHVKLNIHLIYLFITTYVKIILL
ncbi:MAG: MFS transporter, partial [Candidatus Latescibacter sp.]|nr:MFS transporter [Candidatus Latescibacter sp.]